MENPNPSTPTDANAPNGPAAHTNSNNRKFALPDSAKISLLFFLLAGSLTVALLPHSVSKTSAAPSFSLFLLAGLLMVAVTALLFNYLNRLSLGFGRTALVMAAGYNAVIAIIKFTLAPQALYTTNQQTDFVDLGNSPNSPSYYLATGLLILLLYILVFRLVYRHFSKRLKKQGAEVKVQKPIGKRVLFLLLKIIGVVIVGGVVLIAWVMGGAVGPDYLQYIFTGSAIGLLVVIAVALAIYLAYKSFDEVNKQVASTGNATLLAGFFWLGLSLIVLYHVMWLIFMITLVNLWPFRTYAPK